jgi:hypothetical protein
MALTRALLLLPLLAACRGPLPDDEHGYTVEVRDGTEAEDYLSSGERGSVMITEINWAGSVRGAELSALRHDPDDVFIELQNKMTRPVHLTDWLLVIESDRLRGALERDDREGVDFVRSYRLPRREGGQPAYTNEYLVIARKRDGAFPEADFYLDELELPTTAFRITLRDLDLRLIDSSGSLDERVFAGGWDLVSVRSMERVQLIFANSGERESSWHAYSLHPWSPTQLHEELRARIAPSHRGFTFATPGLPNSPDYSGNTSSGSFE